MKKLILILVALVFAGPAMAERMSLPEVSAYLNTITTAKARFVQINADGSKSKGTLYINKPGRARFEYDPPNDDALVMAGGGQIAVFDGRASGKPEQYPLARTPMSIILARNVDLTRTRMVTGHGEQGDRTLVQAQDPDHPEYGNILLYFDNQPTRLSEWLITAESGEKTRVILAPFETGVEMSPFLFDISYESGRR
jgi:outer membrane lipoprotein-sorting protein